MNKTKKLLWIGFLALHLAIIGFYWWQGSGSLFGTDGNNAMIALGRLAGLLAGLTVLLQFLFMGRMPWLERVFGLDKLAKVHKLNGKLTLLFILTHPLLLSLGYAGASGINVVDQYMSFVFDYEHVWMAAIALWLFVFVVISSIYIVRSRVKFESWYFVHLAVYVAFFMSYFHQAEVGTDLIVSKVFAIYWIALYATVFGMHVVFRFGVPLYNFFRHGFVVDKVVRETGSAVSIYIKGKAMDRFKVDPGQFMIFRFL
ncbi:MAG TPA: ferric reductase-like transmembrane domain-containing protein, partial [Candidatus Gracilibacteria bacterium]|nr:ferric reductase-like transmembrane domain-containing protein [Candidatus Gracilibacteria bacterium]